MFKGNNKERKAVVLGIGLYLIGALFGVFFTLIVRGTDESIISNQGVDNLLFVFLRYIIVMAIVTEVIKGKNWARVVMIVFAFLNGLSFLLGVPLIMVNLKMGIISLIVVVSYILCGFHMILSKNVKSYFTGNRGKGNELNVGNNYVD